MRSSCVPHAFDSSRSGRDACRQKVLPTVGIATKRTRAVRGAQRRNRTTSNAPSQCARPSARVRSAVHVRVELAAASLGALAAKAVGSSFYLMTLIRDSRASALLPFHEFPFFSNSLSNSFIAVFQVWAFALFRRTGFSDLSGLLELQRGRVLSISSTLSCHCNAVLGGRYATLI